MSHSRTESDVSHAETASKNKSWWVTPFSAAFGGAMGAVAAYPFEGLKKSVQSDLIKNWRQAFTLFLHPRELYRGTTAFATSLIPTTIIQMSMKAFFDQLALSDSDKQAADVVCGASGAFASAAAEKLILTQRYYKLGPSDAVKYVVKHQGFFALWHGLIPLAVREAVFGTCMLKYGKEAYNNYGFLGSIAVGFGGALISHPFDSMATKMQLSSFANKNNAKAMTMREAAQAIYFQNGIKGFYKGAAWRLGLFTTCMVTIPAAEGFLSNQLTNYTNNEGKTETPCLKK